jgi:hypothetical protein
MNQLRLIWARKRRTHGPNSTPFVSNWIASHLAPALRVARPARHVRACRAARSRPPRAGALFPACVCGLGRGRAAPGRRTLFLEAGASSGLPGVAAAPVGRSAGFGGSGVPGW